MEMRARELAPGRRGTIGHVAVFFIFRGRERNSLLCLISPPSPALFVEETRREEILTFEVNCSEKAYSIMTL